MSLWLEHKYVLQVGMYLDQFKRTDEETFKFRCPLCGDSKKSKTLCRGYLYVRDGRYKFKCHNCGATPRFDTFLAQIAPDLYSQYKRELLQTRYDKPKKPKGSVRPAKADYSGKNSPLHGLSKISSLPNSHPAKKYLLDRQIPAPNHWKLFYCPDFNTWGNKLIPNKFDERIKEDRILIPLFDEDKTFRGVQGRSLNPHVKNQLRYLTVIMDKTSPVLYNAENVDFTKDYWVFEGPFDSMFVQNSCATLTATSNYPFKNKEKLIRVLDNQPRNKEVVAQYNKAIENGERLVIWPHTLEAKDINDMVKAGIMSSFDVEKYLSEHVYSGLDAKLRFSKWKKI